MTLIVSAAAAADLARLRAFIEKENPDAARRVAATLSVAIGSLAALPERGRRLGATGIRELIVPFGGSAYVLRYAHSASTGEVVVVRVWHGREARE